jgi:cysteine desulfurase
MSVASIGGSSMSEASASGDSGRAASIYLDYAATTPVAPEVAARMTECLTLDGTFGNPGSESHGYGAAARTRVEAARGEVAAAVGASSSEIVWTSGATEANNLAIFGVAHYYREAGRHIVTVRTEHKSVLDPCRELERRGWSVTYLTPDRDGALDPAHVAAAVRPDTVLVCVMHVNNEIGTLNDIASIAAACAAVGSPRLHVDAAQSVGKVPVELETLGADLLSLSAHKAYGPKGVGALVVSSRRATHLTPILYGGGQERSLRSGTLATHQAVGMGAAFALASADREREHARIGALRRLLLALLEPLGGVWRNGACTVPHIVNVSFEGVEGESLLADIGTGLAVSTGSACSSASREPSYVLRALGRDDRLAESSLRFSLGRYTTESDVRRAAEIVRGAVTRLRRIAGTCV